MSGATPLGDNAFRVEFEGPLFDGRGDAKLAARLRLAMTASVARIESVAAANTPVNTGALRQSVGGKVVEFGPAEASGMPAAFVGQIGSPLPYAPFVEYGRLPGKFPPAAPIEAWVRRKLRGAVAAMSAEMAASTARRLRRERGRADRYPRQARSEDRAVASLTFLVQRSIARWGTPNRRMIRNAIASERDWVVGAFRAAVRGWTKEV